MKRKGFIFLLFTVTIVTLTGCGTKLGLNLVRTIPLPDSYSPAAQNTVTPQMSPESSATADSAVDQERFKALDEIKERAIAEGYETTALFDFQKSMAPGATDGFNIEIGDYSIPVLVFPTPEDAQTYADAVNAAGYNLAVVNGRYMSMITAADGSAAYPEQQTALESIMDAKAQIQDR